MYALSTNGETTFFEDVLNYIKGVFSGSDSGYYANLGFEKSPLISLRMLLLGIFIGAIIACIAMAYNKQVLGGAIRKIIEKGCNSPDKAMTLAELGLEKNAFIRSAVRGNVNLRRFVKCVEEDEYYADERTAEEAHEQRRKAEPSLPKYKTEKYMVDPATAHFYIPEELRIRAEIRFEKKGSGFKASIVGIILLCIIFFFLLLAMPLVLDMINDFLGSFKD